MSKRKPDQGKSKGLERFFIPRQRQRDTDDGLPTLRDDNGPTSAPAPRRRESPPPFALPMAAASKRSSSAAVAATSPAKKARQLNSSSSSQKSKHRKKETIQLSIGQAFKSNNNNNTVQQPTRRNFLDQDCPDPSSDQSDHRVTEIQFMRETTLSFSVEDIQQPTRQLPLNAEQRRVVECPPDIPLSVRAGAGSGKTHAMVQRAILLVNQHNIDPENILMITFSNKATDELNERIRSAFSTMFQSSRDMRIPLIKTFHSLAFSWICKCWKACGLLKFPSPLGSKAQERNLMRRAIEENLDGLRLDRCKKWLWGSNECPSEVSWEMVIKRFRDKVDEDVYNELDSRADEKAQKLRPKEKTVKSMTAEEVQLLQQEIKEARKRELRLECYLWLLRSQSRKLKSDVKEDTHLQENENVQSNSH